MGNFYLPLEDFKPALLSWYEAWGFTSQGKKMSLKKSQDVLAWWPIAPSRAGQKSLKQIPRNKKSTVLAVAWVKKENSMNRDTTSDAFGWGVNVICGKWQISGDSLVSTGNWRMQWDRMIGEVPGDDFKILSYKVVRQTEVFWSFPSYTFGK